MSSKVFVGNLSFKTETEQLREHFSAAGTVTEANIITRGPRSLGYGFVDFKTPEDAENAVKLFNQKEIDGRVINVEVAHPRQEEAANGEKAGAAAGSADGARPPRARRGRGGRPQTAEGEGAPQPREGGRRFRAPRPTADGEVAEGENTEGGRPRRGYSGTGSPRGAGFARGRGGARRGAPRTNPDGTPVAAGAPGSPKPAGERAPRPFRERKPREPQAPRPQRPKEQSETTLFVANLPFAVTDAELSELFAGLKVTKAHVVVKRNGKSKGFGFVEFANQEDQLAALKAKDGEVYQERPLNVKVALVQAVADAAAAAAAEAEKPAEGADAAKEAAPATETKEEKAAEPKAAETSA
jgi:RNA recognition motif-containing protein